MRKLIALTFISLDGVMQAPGSKGEDPSGGFDLEGWSNSYFDEALGEEMAKQMTPPYDILLGRTTYEHFSQFWPTQGDQDPFINSTKYIVSDEPLDKEWGKVIQVSDDVVGKIRSLKEEDGPVLQVHGSSNLLQTLLSNDLVDELWLKIHPVTLGKGKRLFGEGTIPAAFTLVHSRSTPSGVIVASYRRAGDLKLSSNS